MRWLDQDDDDDDWDVWEDEAELEKDMTPTEEVKEHTLSLLTEGRDLENCRSEAKDVLRLLTEQTPRFAWRVVVPIARRLMSFDGWQDKLSVAAVRDHCLQRDQAATLLRSLPRTDDCDPEAEFLGGVAENLHQILWQNNEEAS